MGNTDRLNRDFSNPDYRDHFVVTAQDPFGTIDDFIERLALNQPPWLIRVSTGISGRAKLEKAVASMSNQDSPGIGNWKLIDRTEDSVTFAEDMKIMRYRLTYTLEDPLRVSARTEVVQQSRWTGRTYWALITPFHQRFLQLMLRNAAGPNSTTKKLNPAP